MDWENEKTIRGIIKPITPLNFEKNWKKLTENNEIPITMGQANKDSKNIIWNNLSDSSFDSAVNIAKSNLALIKITIIEANPCQSMYLPKSSLETSLVRSGNIIIGINWINTELYSTLIIFV